jgi:hypothetical protein
MELPKGGNKEMIMVGCNSMQVEREFAVVAVVVRLLVRQ